MLRVLCMYFIDMNKVAFRMHPCVYDPFHTRKFSFTSMKYRHSTFHTVHTHLLYLPDIVIPMICDVCFVCFMLLLKIIHHKIWLLPTHHISTMSYLLYHVFVIQSIVWCLIWRWWAVNLTNYTMVMGEMW